MGINYHPQLVFSPAGFLVARLSSETSSALTQAWLLDFAVGYTL